MPAEIFLPLSLMCAGIVFVRYYRIRRLAAGTGWVLMILSIGGFGSGLASSFTWAGFVFIFIALSGLVIVIQDVAFRRQAKSRREQSRHNDLRHRV
jgi:hypothetical protein